MMGESMLNKDSGSAIDLSEVRHIERITVGKLNPTDPNEDTQIQQKMDQLNALLNGSPKGVIIGKDITFRIVRVGEHTVALQQVSYHIGFKRKPSRNL